VPKGPCIFCEIVAGRSPAYVLDEDDRCLAFLDIFPLTTGHSLVIPKAHADDLLDALGAPGINLLQATGAIALQTVFHLHIHVLPRYPGDGFRVAFDRDRGDPAELAALAGRLSAV
jgi:histidine triad (HIT) family protein